MIRIQNTLKVWTIKVTENRLGRWKSMHRKGREKNGLSMKREASNTAREEWNLGSGL